MTFASYLRDKRRFLLLFASVMVIVGIMMRITEVNINNIMYTLFVSCFLAAVYLVCGYFYHRPFYRDLADRFNAGQPNASDWWPEPRTSSQAFIVDAFRALQKEHLEELDKLQQQIKDHQDFILSWIHEVKIPISAGRLLLDRGTSRQISAIDLADRLEDELDKIEHYVEQALYYSRIDSFSKDYFIAEVSLPAVMKACIKKYAKLFISRGIRFRMEEGALTAHSDGKWLAFILDQIIANALKYTPVGGEVTACFEEDETEKRLTIADTGIGILPEETSRVFDRGFTGSNGRLQSAKSTGMGLYLAKQMAIKLGHDLSVHSEVGAGTRLTVHFPKFRTYRDL